ncbi:MAG: helicase [Ruminococcus sp.]|nr:helicase [Ruminococcus sp.]
MKSADAEWVKLRQYEQDVYGDMDAIYQAYEDGEIDSVHQGYAKTKFIINMPDGTRYTERQDIGDGDGGVIDFLGSIESYKDIVPLLEQARDNEPSLLTPVYGKEFVKELEQQSDKLSTLNEDVQKDVQSQEDIIISSDGKNYSITDDDFADGTKSERYANNINAIKTLKEIESSNRQATPAEQEILAKYVGWGGLDSYFKSENNGQLKALLDESEYKAALASTLTSFYTPPTVIRAVYKVLDNLGFKSGNVLEPSCGVGNFIGLCPQSMKSSKFYGVELDDISGRIASKLYPQANIAVQGFETTNLPDNFFDVAVGNVPFAQMKVLDKKYDKYNFLIHDYFFAKTLDKVRPGGIVAFITSKGTMDKKSCKVRKYIAQRAELLGAVRLPNNTFSRTAGTEVTSDVLFLQKRERMIDIEPDWVHLGTDDNGITINSYFVEHPEMICGEMQEVSGPYGTKAECIAYENADLEDLLNEAVANIGGEYKAQEIENLFDNTENIEEDEIIPATPDVKNYSYTVVDGDIYYRQNSIMERQKLNATAEKRIKALVKVREALRGVLNNQLEDMPDEVIKNSQLKLNNLYDNFINEFGYINTRANLKAFEKDDSINLLASLEKFDSEKNYKGKSDIFSRRTIKPHKAIDKVETAADALAVSIAEKAKVDLEYMSRLYGKSVNDIVDELEGAIFNVPGTDEYQTADEYLSGNVRRKLRTALSYSYDKPEKYDSNIAALKAVQPTDLTASEIDVRLGATWLPVDVVRDFMYTTFGTPRYVQDSIEVSYSEYNSEWRISHKSLDKSVNAVSNYGTKRVNAYKILEDTLNLKDVRVFDNIYDDGKEKRVLNQEETAIAQSKQELIKSRFASWVFSERNRRERLCRIYNERFNSVRPREYDGSFLVFDGMNTEIRLRDHQRNAVAHAIYGGNTLLAHTVGAGKTFEMVAIAMESKRLGLCNKSLFVVPNHLTEQMGIEFMQLYPAANILVATKKDFETANRKKFCSRIATGDYDAVVIGHSQFEKIPMSTERQCQIIETQIDEVIESIRFAEEHNAENFTIKQLEKTKKNLETKLKKLYDQSRKDDVVTFEELGVDKLFVDEAHYYKNLFLYTKMRNVAGVGQTEAQKSSDLFMKCRYLDEITDGKGVVFATGTPISNSMTELYTMQRYLQYNKLSEQRLSNFDAWASTFGETITALELSPEGNGYRAKTRFAKFFNLPELMSTFREIADIKTADVLNLDVPKVERHNILTKPSEQQEQILEGLAQRAESVRNGNVDPSTDNMLKITNDGRKLALDQRLINPMLPDFEGSKLNACADNIFSLWDKTKEDRLAQMVFCDISTPNGDKFNVYDDLKEKLMVKGIPENEIAFIHDAKTNQQKQDIFSKVRSGNIRVIIGSTSKMGAGTNCQDKLIALHHLDCPWRPADLQQREGRIIRQGNKNPLVHIYSYVTENTFDAYLYQLVENKQKFISQIMTSKSPVRSAEDVDETALSYSEIKALASGNPLIKEKMDLDVQVSKLKILKANFLSVKYELEDQIASTFPQKISSAKYNIEKIKSDIELVKSHIDDDFALKLKGITYDDKKEAGQQLLFACDKSIGSDKVRIGEYKDFSLDLRFDAYHTNKYVLTLNGSAHYDVELGEDIFGNLTRIDNVLKALPDRLESAKKELLKVETDYNSSKEAVNNTFDKEDELNTKLARLKELNNILEMDKSSTKKEDTSNDSEYHYTKVTEKQKEILSSNGYKDFAKADDGKNFIVKYPTVDKDKVQHLLCNNTIKL